MRKLLLPFLLFALSANAQTSNEQKVGLPLYFTDFQTQLKTKYSDLPYSSVYYFQKSQHQKAIALGCTIAGAGIGCGGAFIDNRGARIAVVSTGGALGLVGIVYCIKSIVSGNKAVFTLERELNSKGRLGIADSGLGLKMKF